MSLDFGIVGEQSNIQTADYKSAGSHQEEILVFLFRGNGDGNWGEIYTVPTGFTFYVSGIVITTTAGLYNSIGTGAAASETEIFKAYADGTTGSNVVMGLVTPVKFVSGTRISVRHDTTGGDTYFNLIGWIE